MRRNASGQPNAIRIAQTSLLDPRMWLIVLEALLALALLVFIVWWTMFHGRKERPPRD
jgi:hypothetical protein